MHLRSIEETSVDNILPISTQFKKHVYIKPSVISRLFTLKLVKNNKRAYHQQHHVNLVTAHCGQSKTEDALLQYLLPRNEIKLFSRNKLTMPVMFISISYQIMHTNYFQNCYTFKFKL